MPTPLERQILDGFEKRLIASDAIPYGLVEKLMAQARSDRVPSAEVLLEAIKANAGDQSV